jgi:hypothetical protein
MAVGRWRSVALDCADPQELAEFWVAVIGGEIGFSSEQFVAVNAGAMWLAMVRVPDYRPPEWPDGDVPKQIHLDLSVDDLDSAETEAMKLGARKAEEQPAPDRWRVLLDPAGHPFCLSTQIPG